MWLLKCQSFCSMGTRLQNSFLPSSCCCIHSSPFLFFQNIRLTFLRAWPKMILLRCWANLSPTSNLCLQVILSRWWMLIALFKILNCPLVTPGSLLSCSALSFFHGIDHLLSLWSHFLQVVKAAEKTMAPHPSAPAWKIHGRRSLVGLSAGGC